MIECLRAFFLSSIGKKQVLAITGFFLCLFVLGHLGGNFLIFKGPEAFNGYAEKLASLGIILWLVRIGIITIFLVHLVFMSILVVENWMARDVSYKYKRSSPERSIATKTMPYTGVVIFVYIIFHLLDFTFAAHEGVGAMIANKDLGLYGVVVNTFLNPYHSLAYIVVMILIGWHISHGIQSVFQTIGIYHSAYTPGIKVVSDTVGLVVAVAFSSIPIFIMVKF